MKSLRCTHTTPCYARPFSPKYLSFVISSAVHSGLGHQQVSSDVPPLKQHNRRRHCDHGKQPEEYLQSGRFVKGLVSSAFLYWRQTDKMVVGMQRPKQSVTPPLKPTSGRKLYKLDDNNLKAAKVSGGKSEKESKTLHSPRFADFDLHPGLLEALVGRFGSAGRATAIQDLSLKHFSDEKVAQEDRDKLHPNDPVLLAAETGSGKTLAYLLPLVDHLKATDLGPPGAAFKQAQGLRPRSIVLSPTHELTRQLTESAKLLAHSAKLRVVGLSSAASGAIPRKGTVDICVATGGSFARALGIAKQKDESVDDKRVAALRPDLIEWIVVDEADVLLGESLNHLDEIDKSAYVQGPNFVEDTKAIIDFVIQSRKRHSSQPPRVILSTATLPPSLMTWLEENIPSITIVRSPSLHRLPTKLRAKFVPFSGSGNRLADVAHEVKRVLAEDARERVAVDDSLRRLDPWADRKAKIIIFCNTEGKVRMLSRVLEDRALPCLAVTSNTDSRTRGSNGELDSFLLPVGGQGAAPLIETKVPRVLVTTSLLSRGLDFAPDVRHVFILDTPRDTLDFIHRAGRSARAGRAGSVTVFGGRESLPPGIRQLLGQ